MIDIEHITAGYGKNTILHDISVSFPQGKLTMIAGENGSGKSTLLKAVAGLCEVTEGRILIHGQNRQDIDGKTFAQMISYLPQNRQIPSITVERMVLHGRFPYLGYPRHYRKEDHEICDWALETIGITSLRYRRVDELSGGERQKVYLSMALASQTECFLFDEPMTFLDIRRQLELLELMERLKAEGKTLISVLHDVNAVLAHADSIVLLKEGQLAMQGTSEQIVESGVIETVFQVKEKMLKDENGKKYYLFNI